MKLKCTWKGLVILIFMISGQSQTAKKQAGAHRKIINP